MDTNQEATAVVQAREMMIKIKLCREGKVDRILEILQAGQLGLDECRGKEGSRMTSGFRMEQFGDAICWMN